MFTVPEIILSKLKCDICDGYLNAKPVVAKCDKQICAKCYKILPADEREQCQRQISFEALGGCLIFPCRYHKVGCDFTYTWNNENGHESECKKRYFTVPDVVSTSEKIKTTEEVVEPGKTNPAFTKDMSDKGSNRSIRLNLEGSVHYSNTSLNYTGLTECNNNNNNNGPALYENIYSSIGSRSTIKECLNCRSSVDKSTQSVCLFGHISCINCKSEMCVACVKNLDGNSRIVCKNASKGCKMLLHQSIVGVHRDNCEFNEIACPVPDCTEKHFFNDLMKHLNVDHEDKIIISNQVSKSMTQRDQILIILCHKGIFKCLYSFYNSSSEIMVIYLGPCAKAADFSYEVSVEGNDKFKTCRLPCTNWNNCMLESGICFDKTELGIPNNKPLKFTLNLKIIQNILG